MRAGSAWLTAIGRRVVPALCLLVLGALASPASAHFDSRGGHAAYFHVTAENFTVTPGYFKSVKAILIRIVAVADNHDEDKQLSFIRINPKKPPSGKFAIYLHPDCVPREGVHITLRTSFIERGGQEDTTAKLPGTGLVASEERTPSSYEDLADSFEPLEGESFSQGFALPPAVQRFEFPEVSFDVNYGYDGLKGVSCKGGANLKLVDQRESHFKDVKAGLKNISDTDGDGASLAYEQATGTNPNDPNSKPAPGALEPKPPTPPCTPNCPPPPTVTPATAPGTKLQETKGGAVYMPISCNTATGLIVDYCSGNALLLSHDGRVIAATHFSAGRGDIVSIRFDLPGFFPTTLEVPNWPVIIDKALSRQAREHERLKQLHKLNDEFDQTLAEAIVQFTLRDGTGGLNKELFPVPIQGSK